MPTLTIDGKEVTVEQGMTVLQACELAGADVPRFCYHEKLSIAGNCRMCLVQIEGGPPKPAASCAMPAGDKMVVHTNTPMVKKAREGVMEFLLINHPLDCPICDQAGECDLQDQAMAFGRGQNRFHENKRSVPDKYMGPLIKTHMTRCIHCTRCIRFSTEIAGVEELGATGRGEHMEVGTYVEKALSSELSGNMIDLCPVGALTSKPYAFKARSWELKKTESIDVLDAVGSNIRVDSRGMEVMRILPRLNEAINEEWISDKTRFAYDGLKTQRLDRPMVRVNGKLRDASWQEAYTEIAKRLQDVPGDKIAAIAGDLADAESMLALKELMQKLGSEHIDCRQDGAKLDLTARASYLFNTSIEGIEKADLCLLIGTNPRHEATLVNTRLRKRWKRGGFMVASIGTPHDLTYPVEQLGVNPAALQQIAQGTHPFSTRLKAAKNPMLIIGQDALSRPDGAAILAVAKQIADTYGLVREDWNGFNVLHKAAARVAGLDLGFVPGANGKNVAGIIEAAESGKLDVLYLLGADEIDMSRLGRTFVIYQGHHGDAGAHRADVILPGAAYTEKNATYVNTEGRVQHTRLAVFPPGEAQEDWKIIRQLADVLAQPLPYNSLAELRAYMREVAPHMGSAGQVTPAEWKNFGTKGTITAEPLVSSMEHYYMTDPISRASKIMAECSALAAKGTEAA
jgi:NADH-quinone oxidoreductase subunit G